MTEKVQLMWEAKRIGNEGFVRELYPDNTERSFGPMPANLVPAFIEARRKMWQLRMENRGHTKVQNPTEH